MRAMNFDKPTPYMITYLFKRLRERSTWLGLIALVTAGGAQIEAALAEQIIAVGMAVAGLVGIITKDKNEEIGKEESRG